MKKVLDTYLLFFQINQSTATLRHVFAALRLFVQKVQQPQRTHNIQNRLPVICFLNYLTSFSFFFTFPVPQRFLPGQSRPVRLSVLRNPQMLQPSIQLHPDGGVCPALFFHADEFRVYQGKIYSALTSAGE